MRSLELEGFIWGRNCLVQLQRRGRIGKCVRLAPAGEPPCLGRVNAPQC